MNIETAQKLIEKLGGIEKSKEIIIKEIPIGVIATALAVLGVDYEQA